MQSRHQSWQRWSQASAIFPSVLRKWEQLRLSKLRQRCRYRARPLQQLSRMRFRKSEQLKFTNNEREQSSQTFDECATKRSISSRKRDSKLHQVERNKFFRLLESSDFEQWPKLTGWIKWSGWRLRKSGTKRSKWFWDAAGDGWASVYHGLDWDIQLAEFWAKNIVSWNKK